MVGQQKGGQGLVELGRGLVVVALPGGFLERAVEAFDRAVGPRGRGFGQAVRHPESTTNTGETVPAGKPLMGRHSELAPVVGQHGRGFVGPLFQHPPQKVRRNHARGGRSAKATLLAQVDGPKQVLAAFFAAPVGKANGPVADRLVLELFLRHGLPLLV